MLINELKNNVANISTEINIRKFKTAINTWQNAFDNCIAYITSNYVTGTIRVGVGTFEVTQINLPTSISLIGDSPTNTIIKSIAGNNVDFLVTTSGYYGDVKNLTIDGNKANATVGGLGLKNTSTEKVIDNVYIKQCSKNAYELVYPSFNNKSLNLLIFDCDNDGIVNNGTDQFFGKCIVKRVKGNGFVIKGSNNLFELCKTYYTGVQDDITKGDGFIIDGTTSNANTIRLISCESQECGRHGLNMIKTEGCQIQSFQSDSNSMYSTIGVGILLNQAKNNRVTGLVCNKYILNANAYIRTALQLVDSVFNDIDIKTFEMYSGTNNKPFLKYLDVNNANGTNKVFINGFREGLINEYKGDSRLYTGTGGIASEFEARSITGTTVYSLYLSEVEKCQAISITAGELSKNAQVCKIFPLANINKVGFRVDAKTNNVNNRYVVQLTFLDDLDATVGTSTSIPSSSETIIPDRFNTVYGVDISVPVGATKVRIGLLNHLNIANSVGTVFYKNFEFYKLSN